MRQTATTTIPAIPVLWIDGTEVVNNSAFQGQLANLPGQDQATGAVNLSAGLHSIVIGFFQGA